jgi:hypothetical protein
MGADFWIPTGISGIATLISFFAFLASVTANRNAGPRVSILSSKLSGSGTDLWLVVKISNSGRSEIDVDGAWAGWFGQARTNMPITLRGASSATLTFISTFPGKDNLSLSLGAQIALGNGETIFKRLDLSETEIAYEIGRISALKEHNYLDSATEGSHIAINEAIEPPTPFKLTIDEV